MTKTKRYHQRTINFGTLHDESRHIVEILRKKKGKKLSSYIRHLIVVDNTNKPEYIDAKKKWLLAEYKLLGEKIFEIGEDRRRILKKLEDLGVDVEEVE